MNLKFKNWDLKKCLLATVTWFDGFNLALKVEQLPKLVLGKMVTLEEVLHALKYLDNYLEIEDGYVFLKGRENMVKITEEKLKRKKSLEKRVEHWKWIFKMIPFLKMAAICNYNSFGDVSKKSDIDIFVVTNKGRIFLARTFLTFLTELWGVRRHDGKVVGQFCLSFYASEEYLQFESLLFENDIYFAYWILALDPFYCEEGVWDKLWDQNQWLENYFEEYDRLKKKINISEITRWKKFWEKFWGNKWGDKLEKLLGKYSIRRFEKRKKSFPVNASIIVSEKVLKYHNNDRRIFYRERWQKNLEKFGFTD